MIAILSVCFARHVAPIGNGNALTLPADRHWCGWTPVPHVPPAWFMAVPQDGAGGQRVVVPAAETTRASWFPTGRSRTTGARRDTRSDQSAKDIQLVTSTKGADRGAAPPGTTCSRGGADGRDDGRPRLRCASSIPPRRPRIPRPHRVDVDRAHLSRRPAPPRTGRHRGRTA